jgi:hypothetical protein
MLQITFKAKNISDRFIEKLKGKLKPDAPLNTSIIPKPDEFLEPIPASYAISINSSSL